MIDSVLNTVRYFDLLDQPVTATQLWQWQVGEKRTRNLRELRAAADAAVAGGQLANRWGYYFLPHRAALVEVWLRRHALAQQKWKLTVRIARALRYVPFVRMMAMSGSLAMGNTRRESDLDLFVITHHQRIWLARLGLLVVAALQGRRRRHWDQKAPDKICLNHYVTDRSLTLAPEIRNVYTAVLHQSLLCLTGPTWHRRFVEANFGWIRGYVCHGNELQIPTRHMLRTSLTASVVTRLLELAGGEPVWDYLEYLAEQLQRRYIDWHTVPGQAGRVVVNNRELAFHPNSKVPGLLERYQQGVPVVKSHF